MTHSERRWFGAVPWDSVVTLNKALCQAQKMDPLNNAKGFESARSLWEKTVAKNLTLEQAIEICHECHEQAPFTFNNGNTFAAIGRTLVEASLQIMPPVEAQILRTTIAHYIVGLISERELRQVLRHFEPLLSAALAAGHDAVPPPPLPAWPQDRRAPA